VDPWLAASAGFALSVAASGALILLAPHLTRGMRRWLPGPLALAIAVPLAAQLVCGPIIALFADQQSLVGLAANLLAAPAAPLATVIGMLACLAAPIPPLADLLAASAWLPAAWIAATAQVSAAVPLAQIAMPAGVLSAAVVGVVSAAIAVVLIGGPPSTEGRRVRALAGMVVAVVVAVFGARMLLDGPLAGSTSPDGWSIAACDVGQGDALLVRSAGEVALIDTGPEPEPLAECLRSLGIDRIDLLVLTHFDLDHAGGVEALQGRVDEVVHGPTGEHGDERTLDRLADGGATVTLAVAGMRGEVGGAEWKVLWPQRTVAAFPPGNDLSVVVEFGGGAVPRSVFLGDLSAEAQRMLLRTAHVRGAFDVVKVAHHGSADQDAGLYEALRPAAALISVGEGNDYGHPRTEILAILDAVGAHVLRTDLQGRLLLAEREGELQVWTEE
jgi:competence protein ComEC